MPQPPPHYLEIAALLARANVYSRTDLPRVEWWDGWYDLLTDGSGRPTPAGYQALREMYAALSERAETWDAWYGQTLDPPEGDPRDPESQRRSLKDALDLNSAALLVAYGFGKGVRANMEGVVLKKKTLIAGHVRLRKEALGLFLELYEVYGVAGRASDLEERYPEPPGRVAVNNLPFFAHRVPEEHLTEHGTPGAPPLPLDCPERPCEFPHGHAPPELANWIEAILGNIDVQSGALSDLYEAAPSGPPPGVKADAHERTVAIGRALLAHRAREGAPPDFHGQHTVFIQWAADLIGLSEASVRAALAETGVIGGEGKSGATGRGLLERIKRTERYARLHLGSGAGEVGAEACENSDGG